MKQRLNIHAFALMIALTHISLSIFSVYWPTIIIFIFIFIINWWYRALYVFVDIDDADLYIHNNVHACVCECVLCGHMKIHTKNIQTSWSEMSIYFGIILDFVFKIIIYFCRWMVGWQHACTISFFWWCDVLCMYAQCGVLLFDRGIACHICACDHACVFAFAKNICVYGVCSPSLLDQCASVARTWTQVKVCFVTGNRSKLTHAYTHSQKFRVQIVAIVITYNVYISLECFLLFDAVVVL